MLANYFFVDGSALLGDIRCAQGDIPEVAGAPLNLRRMVQHFTGGQYDTFHGD